MWQELLSKEETVTLPWFGGRFVRGDGRRWKIHGKLPQAHGWHTFAINGSRRATWQGESFMDFERLERCRKSVCGYLVGDRLIPEGAHVVPDPARIMEQSLRVALVEPGLERFTRVRAVRYESQAWVFAQQEFPLGPEAAALDAFLDRKADLDAVTEVTPALDLAFRFESWHRDRVEERRRRIEEKRAREERRRKLGMLIGTGAGRRTLAGQSFEQAARAALAVSGAQLLDVRPERNKDNRVVRFRFEDRRFECVVQARTLRVVDSGICLINHATGEKGDTYFTLESLPAVISQAMREGRLVVFRHV